MRTFFSSIVFGCLASCWAVGLTSGAPPAPARPPAAPASNAADNEAAAKHAKRTQCLQLAKSKKLVGAQKAAYIKDCMGAA